MAKKLYKYEEFRSNDIKKERAFATIECYPLSLLYSSRYAIIKRLEDVRNISKLPIPKSEKKK